MKNYIFRTFVAVMMMMACCATALAQHDTPRRTDRQQRISREQLAEVQARHIANELAFSDAVTEQFVKTYCNCQKEIWALGPRKRPGRQGQTEQENEERIKQRFAMSEGILNIRQKYYKEYSKFLTQKQIGKVYEQERKMMERLAKRSRRMSTPKRHNL